MSIRFTIPGDTLLSAGMQSTKLSEIALVQGRCLELYRVDESITGILMQRSIDNAFLESYSSGNFQLGRQDRVSCYTARA